MGSRDPQEAEGALQCAGCGGDLYPGEFAWHINKAWFCESCARDLYEEEVPDPRKEDE